jgi:DNA-binding winged helix-turn-helix (wHTH) protein
MTDADSRPSPDALLKEAGQVGHGRLKIFLGAAPGVGKTYEMLVQARRRKLEGVDAVIGVVEAHGRVETDLLIKGIETVPKKRIPYKGRVLSEMGLDAILQRRPRLVLVDELAHDNAPGSRHPKRYLDVEEILAAGIDVYTTLNVQHIESLNDCKVAALDLGADDYVSKPLGVEELSARIRAALRHRLQQEGEKPLFKSGDLAVDLVRRIVTVKSAEVKLTPREYDLLRLLIAHAGKVLTHNFILKEVWSGETDVQYLRIYIRTLRQKLEADPEQPRLILTEQGVGYRLRAADG